MANQLSSVGGWMKLNYLPLFQNLFLLVSFIIMLSSSNGKFNGAEIAGAANAGTFHQINNFGAVSWANFWFFVSWFLHWHFCFNDYDCKKNGQYNFNQVMTIFQSIIVFNYWAAFSSRNTDHGTSALDIVVGVFQTLSLFMYTINDIMSLFTARRLLGDILPVG